LLRWIRLLQARLGHFSRAQLFGLGLAFAFAFAKGCVPDEFVPPKPALLAMGLGDLPQQLRSVAKHRQKPAKLLAVVGH
jgi:hypothetical protein